MMCLTILASSLCAKVQVQITASFTQVQMLDMAAALVSFARMQVLDMATALALAPFAQAQVLDMAAALAFVSPGLPGVSRSSSAQTTMSASGCLSRMAFATAARLPAWKATATG